MLAVLLAVLLLTPLRVRFSYGQGEAELRFRYGPAKLQLFPRPPEEPGAADKKKKKKEKKKKKPDSGEEPAGEEKEKKKSFQLTRERILYSLETLPPILGRALGRTRRRIRLGPLKVHLLVAGTDPADTALLYGKLEAALAAGLPALHRLVRIKDQDIQLFPDFAEERMDCIADVGVSIRPWDLVSIGARAGGSLLKWFLAMKRLAPPEEPEESGGAKDTSDTTEPSV